jgi:hypothetical protein
MKLLTFLSVSFFLTILIISPAFPQPPGPGMKHGPGMGMRSWKGEGRCPGAWELNLSPDQTKVLNSLQQTYDQETHLLRSELFSKRLELRESLTDPHMRIESIRSKFLTFNLVQSKLEEKMIEYLIKVKGLLTEEQLKLWCPEQELPFFWRRMHGPAPMEPPIPRKIHPQTGPKEE